MKRLTGAAVLLVAAIAATVSFMHIKILAVQLGQPALAAWLRATHSTPPSVSLQRAEIAVSKRDRSWPSH